jgi:hypothetical protein
LTSSNIKGFLKVNSHFRTSTRSKFSFQQNLTFRLFRLPVHIFLIIGLHGCSVSRCCWSWYHSQTFFSTPVVGRIHTWAWDLTNRKQHKNNVRTLHFEGWSSNVSKCVATKKLSWKVQHAHDLKIVNSTIQDFFF